MLCLNRKLNEAIIIGDNIRVIVYEITPQRVKLAIDAPKDMRIDRAEVRRRREWEQRKSWEN